MTGPDDDEDGPEVFRAVPHPDDRLWRHPSEIAAMHAAHANAETAKVPVVRIDSDPSKSRIHVGLMVAAGVVVVGAAALTIGVISSQGPSTRTATNQVAAVRPVSEAAGEAVPEVVPEAVTEVVGNGDVDASSQHDDAGQDRLAARVHDEIAESLPRIQAVTSYGMREGSGLFVTDDGYIATSAGLIDHAEYVLAWTADGQRWKASVVASDLVSDVAVIHIDSDDWPAVSLGGSRAVRAGQYALALDHDDRSISVGEITSVSSPLLLVDQPSALPGSAIVDDTGAVIAMITSDGTNSHATPAWLLEQVAVDLIASGSTTHLWLGLDVVDAPSGDMVVVRGVDPGSPAERAGVRIGDLIDSLNGHPVVNAASLHRLVQDSFVGAEAVLTLTRHSSRRLVVLTVAELPD